MNPGLLVLFRLFGLFLLGTLPPFSAGGLAFGVVEFAVAVFIEFLDRFRFAVFAHRFALVFVDLAVAILVVFLEHFSPGVAGWTLFLLAIGGHSNQARDG